MYVESLVSLNVCVLSLFLGNGPQALYIYPEWLSTVLNAFQAWVYHLFCHFNHFIFLKQNVT